MNKGPLFWLLNRSLILAPDCRFYVLYSPWNSLSVGELFGSIFLNNAILGLVDFSGTTILSLVQRFFKRQVLQSLCFMLLGSTLLTSSILRAFFFEETRLADLILMLSAKLFASGNFNHQLQPPVTRYIKTFGEFVCGNY